MNRLRHLVCVPYVGEFGWELMNWHGRVRRLAEQRAAERVIVLAGSDRWLLYEDLIERGLIEFRSFPVEIIPGEPNEDHRLDAAGTPFGPAELRCMIRAAAERCYGDLVALGDEAIWFHPDYRSRVWSTARGVQSFRSLRQAGRAEFDVLLVPRRRRLAPDRNLPGSWWERLTVELRGRGLRVETYGGSISVAVRQLSTARLAVGASTGGLHLASLCECPHYVWGSGDAVRWTRRQMTNRQRYETLWNPLGTPCVYDGVGWQPSVEHVVRGTLRALERIGIPEAGRPKAGLRLAWRVRRAFTGGRTLALADELRRLMPRAAG